MGLFSFLKNVGTALAGGKKEAKPAAPAARTVATTQDSAMEELAEAQLEMRLTNHVVGLGLKVENLKIQVEDDKATISGTAANQAEKEKIILAVGNVQGIGTVDDQMSVAPQPEPEPEAVFYTVEKGDNLSKISKAHYGTPNKYMVIFQANKPMLKDPDEIYPGQVLRIPSLEA